MTVKAKPVAKTKTSANAETATTVAPVAKSQAAPKRSAKAARKAPAAAPLKAGKKAAKAVKGKKIKMVRDSFTMPENDYAKLAELKKKCLKAGVHVKKSELLRTGVLALVAMSDAVLLKAVEQLEKIKTGRPAKA